MTFIYSSAMGIAKASGGNPVISVVVVILFYLMFNQASVVVEKLIFGQRFEHWLDPVFIIGFMAYAGLSVYACAVYNGT